MSKLPIGAVYPAAATDPYNLVNHHSSLLNSSKPGISLTGYNISGSNNAGPMAFCVEGALLWLLLVWITSGTAAIITLLVKSCRNRWKSNDDFDWSGLEASIRPAHSTTTTTTIAPSFASSRSVLSAPDPPALSTIPKHQISTRRSTVDTSHRRQSALKSSIRQIHRSRRLQSTQA